MMLMMRIMSKMRRLARLLRLAARFLRSAVSAGFTTTSVIVLRHDARSRLIRMEYAPMSEAGVIVLGAIVSLTPGSSVIDINLPERVMLIHLLDGRDPRAAIAAIRRDFEHDIAELYPAAGGT